MAAFGDPSLFAEFEKERESSDTILLSKYEEKERDRRHEHILNGESTNLVDNEGENEADFFVGSPDDANTDSDSGSENETSIHKRKPEKSIGKTITPTRLGEECSMRYRDLKSEITRITAENILCKIK